MSETLQVHSDNAQLAMAAYADLEPGMSAEEYVDALTSAVLFGSGMSEVQARQFAGVDDNGQFVSNQGYDVIDQYDTGLPFGSGLSATIFQSRATGEYVFAVRGSEISIPD